MRFASLPTAGQPDQAVGRFLSDLIAAGVARAVMVPTRQRHKHVVMQTLVSDPAQLIRAEPFAPVVWANAGTLLASLTFQPHGGPIAAVLRSCEVRAFVELVKLNQASVADLLLIGADCHGRYDNHDWLRFAQDHPDGNAGFLQRAARGDTRTPEGLDIVDACKACEYPVAPIADLRIGLFGTEPASELWLEAVTDKGLAALQALGLGLDHAPPGRQAAIEQLTVQRRARKQEWFGAFKARTSTLDGLAEATAACSACHNCRSVCPVCYCRQCVFSTELFRHDSEKYLQWAHRKGSLAMPTDTLFYHLTRMAHMSLLCVGCGQCSSACPNDVPVTELFRTLAEATQAKFGYVPGRGLDEAQPLSVFQDHEWEETTGQRK